MGFKAKKVYGSYKRVICPFCDKQATAKNEQGIEVCSKHVERSVEDIKCTCGSWLEVKAGKFGRYFNCINCGNINYEKAMQIKEITTKKSESISNIAPQINHKSKPGFSTTLRETTITTDDVEYFS
jgi:hypothetical protein